MSHKQGYSNATTVNRDKALSLRLSEQEIRDLDKARDLMAKTESRYITNFSRSDLITALVKKYLNK